VPYDPDDLSAYTVTQVCHAEKKWHGKPVPYGLCAACNLKSRAFANSLRLRSQGCLLTQGA